MAVDPSYEESASVTADASVPLVQVLATRAANVVRAGSRERAEFVTAVTEAATNIVRHANRGVIVLRAFAGPPAILEFDARDEGPGIADPEAALADGYSRGRQRELVEARTHGMGCGFGTMRRFMDSVRVESSPQGTLVCAQKRVGRR